MLGSQRNPSVTDPADPFEAFHGKPMFSGAGAAGTYLGRIVVELWEFPPSSVGLTMQQRDANGLALLIEPASAGSAERDELLERVASSLPLVSDRTKSV